MAIIGILGGMGPMATVDLFQKIVLNTPANSDQEHFRIIIDNHPQIPSRVEALLHGGESPAAKLIESAILLLFFGSGFIARKHKAFTDEDNFVEADIIYLIVTLSVTNLLLKSNKKKAAQKWTA